MKMNTLEWVFFVLVVGGGLNWGLVGLFEFDLVAEVFGEGSGIARVVYALVGLSTVGLVSSVASKSKPTTSAKATTPTS